MGLSAEYLTRMAQKARVDLGLTTAGLLAAELERSILLDEAYLERRQRQGRYTPTDHTLARTAMAKALAVEVLRAMPEETLL